ncbi:MAG: hypothetical protein R3C14_36840 [Caldilineaceae bacterium]
MNIRNPLIQLPLILLATIMAILPCTAQATDLAPTLIYGEQKPAQLIGVTDATVNVVGAAWWGAVDTAIFNATPTPTAMVALTALGSHIEAACVTPTSTIGVQFLGDQNDGWARIVVDGEPRWQGNTQGTMLVNDDYIEISDLSVGNHLIQVETMVTPTSQQVGHVTVVAFGCGARTVAGERGAASGSPATDSPSPLLQTIYLPAVRS